MAEYATKSIHKWPSFKCEIGFGRLNLPHLKGRAYFFKKLFWTRLNLAVFFDNEIILEWFDLPEPPTYIAATIERETVSRFTGSVGGKYQKIIFCDNNTFIDL